MPFSRIIARGAALGLSALMGCNATAPSGHGSVRIQTSQTAYVPGDSVILTIENTGDAEVHYSACGIVLEQKTSAGWVEHSELGIVCDLQARSVEPRKTERLARVTLPDLQAGTYRLRFESILSRTSVRLPRETRVSNEFQVTAV